MRGATRAIIYFCSGLITQKSKMIKTKKKITTHLHIVMTLHREKKRRKNRYHYYPHITYYNNLIVGGRYQLYYNDMIRAHKIKMFYNLVVEKTSSLQHVQTDKINRTSNNRTHA